MIFHRCAICRADDTPVAADVRVYLEEVEREGIIEWYGTISGTHLGDLVAGQRYRLVLGDGRTGEFLVRRNTAAGAEERAVAFKGTGPLK